MHRLWNIYTFLFIFGKFDFRSIFHENKSDNVEATTTNATIMFTKQRYEVETSEAGHACMLRKENL